MKISWNLFCLFLLSGCFASSQPSICEILKLKNCNNSKRSLSRSAGASLPTVNSAAFNNPAAISLSKGLGIESIHHNGKAQLGIITGTGRIGAAISNSPNDGSFFGNYAIESSNQFRQRAIALDKFEPKKLILAGAFNAFGGDSKSGLQGDIGVIYRRHTALDKDYFGGGFILSFNQVISFGMSTYKDVHYVELSGKTDYYVDQLGGKTQVIYPVNPTIYNYETEYTVNSSVMGIKFSKLALDNIKFLTVSDDISLDKTTVDIYNLSYFHNTWIFSYGRRFEISNKEVYDDFSFKVQKDKSDTFLGAQYAMTNGLLVGGFFNYYLFGEVSLGLTYFF